jgi:hypothetical protein
MLPVSFVHTLVVHLVSQPSFGFSPIIKDEVSKLQLRPI